LVLSVNGIVGAPYFITANKVGKFAISANARSTGSFWDNMNAIFFLALHSSCLFNQKGRL